MKHWLAIASADHVRRGLQGGFMQVCHGKLAPLRRIKPEDGVVYYSPTQIYGVKDDFKSFTAIGYVAQGEPYQVDMGNNFLPFRRDVHWHGDKQISIRPLLNQLELTQSKNWGYALRFGLINLSAEDFSLLLALMTHNDESIAKLSCAEDFTLTAQN